MADIWPSFCAQHGILFQFKLDHPPPPPPLPLDKTSLKAGSISVKGPPLWGRGGCQETRKSQLSLHLLDCFMQSTAKHGLCFNYERKLICNCSHTLFFCSAWLEQDADRKCHKRFKPCCHPKVNNNTWFPLLAIIIFIFSLHNSCQIELCSRGSKSHQLQTCFTGDVSVWLTASTGSRVFLAGALRRKVRCLFQKSRSKIKSAAETSRRTGFQSTDSTVTWALFRIPPGSASAQFYVTVSVVMQWQSRKSDGSGLSHNSGGWFTTESALTDVPRRSESKEARGEEGRRKTFSYLVKPYFNPCGCTAAVEWLNLNQKWKHHPSSSWGLQPWIGVR